MTWKMPKPSAVWPCKLDPISSAPRRCFTGGLSALRNDKDRDEISMRQIWYYILDTSCAAGNVEGGRYGHRTCISRLSSSRLAGHGARRNSCCPHGRRLRHTDRTLNRSFYSNPQDSCAAARASDPVLTSGNVTVRPLYAEVLQYVNDATTQPNADRFSLWSTDVHGTSGLPSGFFANEADRRLLISMTAQDLRCIVAAMERAHVVGVSPRAAQPDIALPPGPPNTLHI